MCVTVVLEVLADGRKLPPHVILKRKTMPKEKLPPRSALLKKRGMLVPDSFKGNLAPDVKKTVQHLNTDLVIIPGGMKSKLQVLDIAVNKLFRQYEGIVF
ncbi:hypothetical protein PR048_018549 [Dryococelus australis]|uniref:DDE-1 domain-containing protein n=1 Tax=Dryococelus australis TaxID=614101 RepID=A0ABQ9HCL0_9NEOP|nr:hypothetical protein PR048_018549 [Dryococelus australis]